MLEANMFEYLYNTIDDAMVGKRKKLKEKRICRNGVNMFIITGKGQN